MELAPVLEPGLEAMQSSTWCPKDSTIYVHAMSMCVGEEIAILIAHVKSRTAIDAMI